MVFAGPCMAIAAASPLYRRRSFCSRARAAVSRLAGIADWTTQPRRDAANYPSGSPAPTERVGFPEETDYTRYNSLPSPSPRSNLTRITHHPLLDSSLVNEPLPFLLRIPLFFFYLCSSLKASYEEFWKNWRLFLRVGNT